MRFGWLFLAQSCVANQLNQLLEPQNLIPVPVNNNPATLFMNVQTAPSNTATLLESKPSNLAADSLVPIPLGTTIVGTVQSTVPASPVQPSNETSQNTTKTKSYAQENTNPSILGPFPKKNPVPGTDCGSELLFIYTVYLTLLTLNQKSDSLMFAQSSLLSKNPSGSKELLKAMVVVLQPDTLKYPVYAENVKKISSTTDAGALQKLLWEGEYGFETCWDTSKLYKNVKTFSAAIEALEGELPEIIQNSKNNKDLVKKLAKYSQGMLDNRWNIFMLASGDFGDLSKQGIVANAKMKYLRFDGSHGGSLEEAAKAYLGRNGNLTAQIVKDSQTAWEIHSRLSSLVE